MTQACQKIIEIMDVFLSISNINCIINLDTVAKNRCGQWTKDKVLLIVDCWPNSSY